MTIENSLLENAEAIAELGKRGQTKGRIDACEAMRRIVMSYAAKPSELTIAEFCKRLDELEGID